MHPRSRCALHDRARPRARPKARRAARLAGTRQAEANHENHCAKTEAIWKSWLDTSLVARGAHSCFAHPVLAARLHL